MCTACCRWPQSIAQGPRPQLAEAAGRHACQLGWRFFFFFFFFGSADPRIFEDSNGSSADPDRSGFRWIRFTPITDPPAAIARISPPVPVSDTRFPARQQDRSSALAKRMLPPANPARSVRQRNHFKLPTLHTTLYQSSPIYFAARTFNELPKHLQSIKNLSEFKRRAQQHFLSYSCPCSNYPNRSA